MALGGVRRPRAGGRRTVLRGASALAELAKSGPEALQGLAGLLLLLALVLLEALNRCQKPRRLWLAIDHGAAPFGRPAAGGLPSGAARGERADGWIPTAPSPGSPHETGPAAHRLLLFIICRL